MTDMKTFRCAFCGSHQSTVPRLVASTTSDAAICGPCAIRAIEVLVMAEHEPPEVPLLRTPAGRHAAAALAQAVLT